MENLKKVKLNEIDITSGFWAERQKVNRDVTIFAVRDRYEETGRFGAFDFDYSEGGEKPRPHFFWDSDVAKWMESAAYILQKHPDESLRAMLDSLIDKIEAHQDPCGYFNIYHTVIEPDNRFRDRDHHELYCLGHLIEAAVAYHNAVGSSRFIDILDKYIDYVIKVFVTDRSAAFVTPGHEEIELALYKLYQVKPDEKYKNLADFFLNERGKETNSLESWCNGKYNQSHLPVRKQYTAEGHCVRANYLYSGMADAARANKDEEMLAACKALFNDITRRKMYITGGVGSSHRGEAFTVAYDLPNDTAYAETCAAIALALFADRMKDIEIDSRYADVVEREIYNGIISGISLDGRCFFYENPLEINLEDHVRHTSVHDADRLPITERQLNFGCSCCPPNVTRLIADIGEYVLSYDDDRVFLHQYMSCSAVFGGICVDVETAYPSAGEVRVQLAGAAGKTLYLRIPGWCKSFTLNADYKMVNGYAAVDIASNSAELILQLEMTPRFVIANPRVRADVGKTAVAYGPLIYCAEATDNDFSLAALRIDITAPVATEYQPFFGAPVLNAKGFLPVSVEDDVLYADTAAVRERPVDVRLIPYYGFANRGESDMRVWLRY